MAAISPENSGSPGGGHLFRLWATRGAFTLVFAWNALCALQFIFDPGSYVGAYQLQGIEGQAALRGLGVAFLMWNATYPLFIWRPQRYRVLGGVILAQQLIGLVGELAIYASLPESLVILQHSIMRFVAFDAAGLVLMALAFCGSAGLRKVPKGHT